MSNVILHINNVDRSAYFVGPVRVQPGGDGQVGSTTIHLNQEAGGLDLRPMDDVKLWVPHNTTTNAGIAAKGRLFGGISAGGGGYGSGNVYVTINAGLVAGIDEIMEEIEYRLGDQVAIRRGHR